MLNFLTRQPFALLGAVGLLSLAQDLIQWQEQLGTWLDAWQAVTRPVWEFALGWLFDWIGWEMPWWIKDYLTMGAITAGASRRSAGREWMPAFWIMSFLAWPLILSAFTATVIQDRSYFDWTFYGTFVYALIIIAINYALIFSGSPVAG